MPGGGGVSGLGGVLHAGGDGVSGPGGVVSGPGGGASPCQTPPPCEQNDRQV